MLVAKHIVTEPALTTPEEFGRKVYAEAVRMGALTVRKVYVIMDGGTYLFKRRGQFWSEEGFAAFTKVYVRYMNNELCYCHRKRSA